MLRKAIAGAAAAAVAYAAVYFSNIPRLPEAAAALLGLLAAYAVFYATGAIKHPAYFIPAVLGAVLVPFLPLPYYAVALSAVFPLTILLFVSAMIASEDYSLDHPVKSLLLSLLAAFLLKAIPELSTVRYSRVYLLFAVTSVFSTDVAAFLAGLRTNNHPLVPDMDPEKTVEGAACGIVYSSFILLLCGYAAGKAAGIPVRPVLLLVYALFASVIGQCGSLSMSVLKRIAGVETFGRLFPSPTGLLDRFGSLLFTIPFTYIFCCMTGGFLR